VLHAATSTPVAGILLRASRALQHLKLLVWPLGITPLNMLAERVTTFCQRSCLRVAIANYPDVMLVHLTCDLLVGDGLGHLVCHITSHSFPCS
jgi:hypothetical protein